VSYAAGKKKNTERQFKGLPPIKRPSQRKKKGEKKKGGLLIGSRRKKGVWLLFWGRNGAKPSAGKGSSHHLPGWEENHTHREGCFACRGKERITLKKGGSIQWTRIRGGGIKPNILREENAIPIAPLKKR